MYDVVMLNFARLVESAAELEERREEVAEMTALLSLEDEIFADAISRATGDRTRLFTRTRIYAVQLRTLGLDSGLEDLSLSTE
jgi:hypothetical protein